MQCVLENRWLNQIIYVFIYLFTALIIFAWNTRWFGGQLNKRLAVFATSVCMLPKQNTLQKGSLTLWYIFCVCACVCLHCVKLCMQETSQVCSKIYRRTRNKKIKVFIWAKAQFFSCVFVLSLFEGVPSRRRATDWPGGRGVGGARGWGSEPVQNQPVQNVLSFAYNTGWFWGLLKTAILILALETAFFLSFFLFRAIESIIV